MSSWSSWEATPTVARDLAGFWIRVWATVIDSLILFVSNLIILYLLHTTTSTLGGDVINWVVGAIFIIAFWVLNSGRTPGDMVAGLRVVREDGSPISLGIAIVRYIMLVIGSLALALGALWVIWDPQKQGWHDKAPGTLVVRV